MPLFLTTDNGTNIVAAARSRELWCRVACVSHNTHLMVLEACGAEEAIRRLLAKVCNVAGHFHHSAKHSSNFREHLKAHTTLEVEGFVTPVKTRWGSFLAALERYIVLHTELVTWTYHPTSPPDDAEVLHNNILEEHELEIAQAAVPVLQHLEDMQLSLQR